MILFEIWKASLSASKYMYTCQKTESSESEHIDMP